MAKPTYGMLEMRIKEPLTLTVTELHNRFSGLSELARDAEFSVKIWKRNGNSYAGKAENGAERVSLQLRAEENDDDPPLLRMEACAIFYTGENAKTLAISIYKRVAELYLNDKINESDIEP